MSNPLILQLPALLGVAVGALATYATTSLSEKARWRRQQASRWDEIRMHAYVEYGDAVKKLSHLAARIAAARGFVDVAQPLAPDPTAMDAINEAEAIRARLWEPVLLLGEPETIAAARAWHEKVWQMTWFAQGRITDTDQWRPAVREANQARDRFYDCARRDLGIKGGAVPTPPSAPQPPQSLHVSASAKDAREEY